MSAVHRRGRRIADRGMILAFARRRKTKAVMSALVPPSPMTMPSAPVSIVVAMMFVMAVGHLGAGDGRSWCLSAPRAGCANVFAVGVQKERAAWAAPGWAPRVTRPAMADQAPVVIACGERLRQVQ